MKYDINLINAYLADKPVKYKAVAITVNKNNVVKEGYNMVKAGAKCSPTIYEDRLPIGEHRVDVIADILYEIAEHAFLSLDYESITDPDYVLANVYTQLMDVSNESWLDQKNVLYTDWNNTLLNVYYLKIDAGEEGIASCWLHHQIIDEAGLELCDIYNAANENNKMVATVKPILNVLKEITGDLGELTLEEDFNDFMLVVTNKDGVKGSGVISSFDVRYSIWKKIGDFYVIPSSVHEILAVPAKSGMNPDELRNIIRDVNRTQVSDEDRLSNNLFICSEDIGYDVWLEGKRDEE